MMRATSSILLTRELQHGEEVVKRSIIGTMKAGDSCVIHANFPGIKNPYFELL